MNRQGGYAVYSTFAKLTNHSINDSKITETTLRLLHGASQAGLHVVNKQGIIIAQGFDSFLRSRAESYEGNRKTHGVKYGSGFYVT